MALPASLTSGYAVPADDVAPARLEAPYGVRHLQPSAKVSQPRCTPYGFNEFSGATDRGGRRAPVARESYLARSTFAKINDVARSILFFFKIKTTTVKKRAKGRNI